MYKLNFNFVKYNKFVFMRIAFTLAGSKSGEPNPTFQLGR